MENPATSDGPTSVLFVKVDEAARMLWRVAFAGLRARQSLDRVRLPRRHPRHPPRPPPSRQPSRTRTFGRPRRNLTSSAASKTEALAAGPIDARAARTPRGVDNAIVDQSVLYHFSEDPAIWRFEPHVPATNPDHRAGVWAIDDDHAPLYWLPRDCPRVTACARTASELPAFRRAWATDAHRVHAIKVVGCTG